MAPNTFREHITEIIGGSGAGIMQVIAGYPFDTVKVRYINSNTKSIYSCIRMMIKDNGFRSFYQGVKSPLYGSVLYNTNMFYSYSLFDRYINNKNNSIFYNSFVSGALVGVTTTFIESPMDLAKTQMQINKNLSLSRFIKDTTYKQYYRGFWPTMLRNIPASGLYFGVYNHMYNYYQSIDQPLFGSFISGGLAGLCCWVSTYPLDNIKTRMQSDSLVECNRKYKNMLDCIKKTPLKQMWSGFIPCIIRAVPVNGFIFLGYEYSKKIIELYE
jgi:solute carrier family 25 carnitine/acylcarnitine transporter 20/29